MYFATRGLIHPIPSPGHQQGVGREILSFQGDCLCSAGLPNAVLPCSLSCCPLRWAGSEHLGTESCCWTWQEQTGGPAEAALPALPACSRTAAPPRAGLCACGCRLLAFPAGLPVSFGWCLPAGVQHGGWVVSSSLPSPRVTTKGTG